MQRKAAPGASPQQSAPSGAEWKELLVRSRQLSNMLRKRVQDDVLAVETAVCSSLQGSSKSTVCLDGQTVKKLNFLEVSLV